MAFLSVELGPASKWGAGPPDAAVSAVAKRPDCRVANELRGILQVQLALDPAAMGLDRFGADVQLARNFLRGEPLPNRRKISSSRSESASTDGRSFVDLKGDCKVGPTQTAVPSGAQLTEQVIHALRNSGYAALRDISVVSRDGILVLRGNVPSYHMKQLAQTVIRKVVSTNQIRNDLKVPETIR